jgi:CDP-paratose 2-epimerase
MSAAAARAGSGAASAPALITGGAGFIGANLAYRLLAGGERVILLDNLSRPSAARNLELLRARHGGRLDVRIADVRDLSAVRDTVRDASFVFHFAAQVAVTRSVTDPLDDFEVNARGTLHVLEALRALSRPPPLLLTSTNKVYGALADLRLMRRGSRYEPDDERARLHGLSESRPLDLHSPYGCSKGAADQYALDYVRMFGLTAVVLRMSCIYGPHQLGSEDQGWIAHFLLRAIRGEPITLYGDGLQVRDALFVADLCDALLAARREIQALSGRAFNLGGGPANTVSLLELVDIIAALEARRPSIAFARWRPGDQRFYVSDCRAFQALTGWSPSVSVGEGVRVLHRWLLEATGANAEPRAARAEELLP